MHEKATKKVAVIDLGTNTFNLLIAYVSKTDFKVIHSEKDGVAIGMGGINQQIITQDAFERGIKTLKKFKEICEENQVEEIRALGTSALRDAKNSNDFLNAVYSETAIKIEIISGSKEADLIYKGVSWSYNFDKTSVIMDIGGGSTEFIFANKTGILDKKSFNIGVSRIYQEFAFQDPYSTVNIDEIEAFLENQVCDFFENRNCEILIGASGSFETFYEMIHNQSFIEHKKSMVFPNDALNGILDWIINSTHEEREEHPYIIPIRRKMAPIAAIKTKWVMKKLGIKTNFVTPCSLKEGVLKEFY